MIFNIYDWVRDCEGKLAQLVSMPTRVDDYWAGTIKRQTDYTPVDHVGIQKAERWEEGDYVYDMEYDTVIRVSANDDFYGRKLDYYGWTRPACAEDILQLKKIAVIGSTSLSNLMTEFVEEQTNAIVLLPWFDDDTNNVLDLCTKNMENIREADEVHLFWDGRSTGTIFDLGMVFALRKKLVIRFLEQKSIKELVEKYAAIEND